MSAMYKEEVPLYGVLVSIVSRINSSILRGSLDSKVLSLRYGDASQSRIDIERHGAIRLGSAQELRTMRKVLAVLGLFPVGYYDLSEAGLPMHATCFRPITRRALRKNPFRIFTSVLRPELIEDVEVRELTVNLVSRRSIFSDELLRLLNLAEAQSMRLTPQQAERFISEALKTFRWQGKSIVDAECYNRLKALHPVLADIACFQTSHINHLTPRTLDTVAAHKAMEDEGMKVKDSIEGPPPSRCPILLRQTSFLAIEEAIEFSQGDTSTTASQDDIGGSKIPNGNHRARFGEIEERGAAVTQAGRALYDKLILKARTLATTQNDADPEGKNTQEATQTYNEILTDVFREYPDDWDTLRHRGLVYFAYRCADRREKKAIKLAGLRTVAGAKHVDSGELPTVQLEELIEAGVVEAIPITYEDFLPLSAAGIFQSNLGSSSSSAGGAQVKQPALTGNSDPEGMEDAMQAKLLDPDFLYGVIEQRSLSECSRALGLQIVR